MQRTSKDDNDTDFPQLICWRLLGVEAFFLVESQRYAVPSHMSLAMT